MPQVVYRLIGLSFVTEAPNIPFASNGTAVVPRHHTFNSRSIFVGPDDSRIQPLIQIEP
jgi:hypothetical protein